MPQTLKQIILDESQNESFVPSSSFEAELKNGLQETIAGRQLSGKGSARFAFGTKLKILGTFFLTAIILMATIIFVFNIPGQNSIAYALENIKKTYQEFLSSDIIIHSKTVVTTYTDNGLPTLSTYDGWFDKQSYMYRNIVTYPNSTVYQIHDKSDVNWSYDTGENSLTKEIYKNRRPDQMVLGEMVIQTLDNVESFIGDTAKKDMTTTDNYLIFKDKIRFSGTQEGKDAYELSYYNRETFMLEKVETYIKEGTDFKLTNSREIVLESLPRTEENIARYFVFDIKLPESIVINTREIFVSGDPGTEVTVTPEVTISPKVTLTPEVTITPKVTLTPFITTTPGVSGTPEVTVPATDNSIGFGIALNLYNI
jgi:hypothetical protein